LADRTQKKHSPNTTTWRRRLNHDKRREGPEQGFIRIKQTPPAAELYEGDGLDPRYERRKRDSRGKPNYSSERLGNRVRETIGLACSLPAIPGLDDFAVADVFYIGHGNSYRVIVYCEDPEQTYVPEEVRKLLISYKGILRADIARAITRKNVPDLVFEVLPPGVRP
jgi:hypothetical protein